MPIITYVAEPPGLLMHKPVFLFHCITAILSKESFPMQCLTIFKGYINLHMSNLLLFGWRWDTYFSLLSLPVVTLFASVLTSLKLT